MDARLQEMLDHHEIRKTLTEYCHGCDRCDEVHMGSVYHEDSWDDHGRIKARGWDFAPLMTAEIRRRTKTLSHLLGQSLIRVNGDEAGVGFRSNADPSYAMLGLTHGGAHQT